MSAETRAEEISEFMEVCVCVCGWYRVRSRRVCVQLWFGRLKVGETKII